MSQGAAVEGPPPFLGQARSAPWQWIYRHGNSICLAWAPQEAAGPLQHLPVTIYF